MPALNPLADIVSFESWIEGAGQIVSHLVYRNGQHLDVIEDLGTITGLGADVVAKVLGGYLFPDRICQSVLDALAGHFGVTGLAMRRQPLANSDIPTPRGEIVAACFPHLI